MQPLQTSFQSLSTKRLLLRELTTNDEREIFNLRSNEQVNRYLDREPASTMDDASNFIDKIQRGKFLYWAICLKENPKLIGTICVFDISTEEQSAEIGFELLPFYQGKGIMQEAIEVVTHFGFQVMQLKSIIAVPSMDNLNSIKLLERNGFAVEPDQELENQRLLKFVLKN